MSIPTHPADPQLVRAAAGGDKAAFSHLYQRFAPRLYNLVWRSVRNAPAAEDLCQTVWVRAYQKLPELRDPAAFSTWLYRMASRACIDRARAIARAGATDELPEQLAAPAGDSPEQAAIRHERERVLWQALGALPARQHLALFLREVEGLSYREIAAILNTTPSAIETLLFRARRAVAAAFERLQSVSERCGQARKTMAVVIDGEATLVQRHAVRSHVDECLRCRGTLRRLRRASEAYAVLPLVPLPALLAERVLQEIGAATVATAGSGALSQLLALFTAKAKLTTAALTITGAVAIATTAVPGDSLEPNVPSGLASAGVATPVDGPAADDPAPATQVPGTSTLAAATVQLDIDLAAAATAVDMLQQLSERVATAFPALPQLSRTPAALDQLEALLTPPAVLPPPVTPPLALPTVTAPVALP